MVAVPEAPIEGASTTSSAQKAILFMTESDGGSGLQATLFRSTHSETVNGQLLGALAVSGLADNDEALKGNPIPIAGMYEATPTSVDDGDVKTPLIDAEGRLEVVIDESFPITATLYNVTLTDVDTEYSQSFPDNTMAFRFKNRASQDTRFAWETGKVAGPVAPYRTLPADETYEKDNVAMTGHTLYLASGNAGDIIEIEVWCK